MLQNHIYSKTAEIQMNKGVAFWPHDVQCSDGPSLKSSMENVSVLLAFYTKGHKPLMADLMSVLVATFPFCVRNKSLHQRSMEKASACPRTLTAKFPQKNNENLRSLHCFKYTQSWGGSWQFPLKHIICIMQGSARGFLRGTETCFYTCPNHSDWQC